MTALHRDEMLYRLHYRSNPRIAPILAIGDEGWWITTRKASPKNDLGSHGYDNTFASMQAIMIAAGPNFKSSTLSSSPTVIPSMANVDIYSLLCHLLRISPAPNNGSLDTMLPYITL
jgi:ectonucleotide pyrophosphatase/phosphodiesterase family protein 5